ncbi:MAG: 1-phosphofructokinase family hexose kinase, partial [Chloroflexi bacterium]|nr:1-phosphofructokinase family hexose kinase [Chloroflexota bacterium]
KTYVVPGFQAGGIYRLETVVPVAGGKALNVAKTARLLGVPEVICTGFVAGRTGDWIRKDLEARGIQEDFLEVAGESREDILVVDPSGGAETRLLEPGITVDAPAVEKLVRRVGELARASDLLVLAGSLPHGVGDDLYARLVGEVRRSGGRVFLDAEGEALRQAVSAGPDLIKVNEEEFAALTGRAARGPEELAGLGRKVLSRGNLVVTLGGRGAVWVGPEAALLAEAPPVAPLMTVGSGDAFLGGYAVAVLRGDDPPQALALGVAAGTANTLCLRPGVVEPGSVEALRAKVRIAPLALEARQPDR